MWSPPRPTFFHTSYDGDGKRVKKYVPDTGEVTVFVYDASGKSIAEYSTIVAISTDAKVNYLTSDHLGSPRINTDAKGAIISRHDYHPFGEEIDGTGGRTTGLNYGDDSVRKQFTGYERDDELGLDYARTRYLNTRSGRFTTPDSIFNDSFPLDPQSWNLYRYAANNPLMYVDPTGRTLYVMVNGTAYEYRRENGEGYLVDSDGNRVDVTSDILDMLNELYNRGSKDNINYLMNHGSTYLSWGYDDNQSGDQTYLSAKNTIQSYGTYGQDKCDALVALATALKVSDYLLQRQDTKVDSDGSIREPLFIQEPFDRNGQPRFERDIGQPRLGMTDFEQDKSDMRAQAIDALKCGGEIGPEVKRDEMGRRSVTTINSFGDTPGDNNGDIPSPPPRRNATDILKAKPPRQ